MPAKLKITQTAYAERRSVIAEKMPPMSMAILPGARKKIRNGDAEYLFRQSSDFYYLTGFSEPNAFLVLRKDKKGVVQFILFCEIVTPAEEKWTGKKVTLLEAVNEWGADIAYENAELDLKMPELLAGCREIYYTLGRCSKWDKKIIGWAKKASDIPGKRGDKEHISWQDFYPLVASERVIKSPAEIKLIQKACEISANAHVALMKHCLPNQREYELEALFLQQCYQAGCRSMAYSSIVGGGSNACVLHYVDNQDSLKSGDLVLVDAGGEFENYAADITRTFPVNGQFTDDQKSIYNLVLKAQQEAIEIVKPGIRFEDLQKTIVQVLVEGLVSLGILKGDAETLIKEKAYFPFYMHNSGHWLGLDVHDAGDYYMSGESCLLKEGMVLTVEPGLYFSLTEQSIDAKWRGIGVRIEDDILVTRTGCEVLTLYAPKTVEAIEATMQRVL